MHKIGFFIPFIAPPFKLLALFSSFPANNILLTNVHMNTLIRENYFLSSQFTLCSSQHRELKIFFICLILLSLPFVTNVHNSILHSNVSFYIMRVYFCLQSILNWRENFEVIERKKWHIYDAMLAQSNWKLFHIFR